LARFLIKLHHYGVSAGICVEKLAKTEAGVNERSYGWSNRGAAMSSAAPVAMAPEPAELWFALQTRYRFEKKVAQQLAGKGMEVFLPLRKESREWSDRQKMVTVPLFPGYAFVRSVRSVALRLLVLQTAGVMGFVSFAGTAAIVSEKQIDDLRLLLAQEVPFSMYPFLQTGKRVRIRGGCLDGVEGLLTQRDKGKLVISIESIQRSLAVEIQGYDVDLI
jgi:transcription antitermination factor NusG